ncbi:hypothetical protein BDN71DRAFT_837096 [Pleurotus eryngii]|uniref:Uncharacterized protein n=1 Tax=Pleurotus eryngii TaxID=5323 RepID=A0A9P6A7R1_PLEER|nr:hypothetical protein BDN71DRAFT_837096 [Pleurotus eryngii]
MKSQLSERPELGGNYEGALCISLITSPRARYLVAARRSVVINQSEVLCRWCFPHRRQSSNIRVAT